MLLCKISNKDSFDKSYYSIFEHGIQVLFCGFYRFEVEVFHKSLSVLSRIRRCVLEYYEYFGNNPGGNGRIIRVLFGDRRVLGIGETEKPVPYNAVGYVDECRERF